MTHTTLPCTPLGQRHHKNSSYRHGHFLAHLPKSSKVILLGQFSIIIIYQKLHNPFFEQQQLIPLDHGLYYIPVFLEKQKQIGG